MARYEIVWGHSGTRGREWQTAREASRYAGETWGEVEAASAAEAVDVARGEGVSVTDWYEEQDRPVIHVI